jgi:copper chaperone CopZ
MRIAILSLVLALVACQRADQAEHSAEMVAAKASVAPAGMSSKIEMPAATVAQPAGCGGSCGGSCGSSCSCGGSCGGGGAAVQWGTVPVGSTWTEMHVTGMHCGGCARRIENALSQLDGIVGAQIDVTTGTVKVATARGVDARKLATPAIDGLGYRVQ